MGGTSLPHSHRATPTQRERRLDGISVAGNGQRRRSLKRLFAITLAALPVSAFGAADLGLAVEQFTGRAAVLDRRMPVSACGQGWQIGWQGPASVAARCEADGRQVAVLLAPVGQANGVTALRRGQMVQAEAIGDGFSLRVEAVADSNAPAGGLVGLRNSRSEKRFSARMDQDGRIILPGAE